MAAAAVPVLLLSTTGAWAFSASFAWCAGSPRFTLQDVPAGTTQLQFAMTDLNKPELSSWRRHGGLSRAGGSALRSLRERLHRPFAAAGRDPHLRVRRQSARRQRCAAGDDDRAAQIPGIRFRPRDERRWHLRFPKAQSLQTKSIAALGLCRGMIFSENRFPLFRIMPYSAATALTSIKNSSRTRRSTMSSVLGG